MRIDAHHHFWKFDPERDSWITEDMAVIRKDFLPEDLHVVLQENGFEGCVSVQADQSEDQTNFLVGLAEANKFIRGIVGWVDLRSKNIEERLEHFSQYKILKGFRHVLQGEVQRDLMLTKDFKRGIAALQKFSFTYDILIFPDQLRFCSQFVNDFRDQKFVIDHLAKPYIKRREIDEWKKDIKEIAKHENVWCKLSGMVTEADWNSWKRDDFKPYLDVITEAFGVERIMFGSDWPVCLVAATYREVVDIIQEHFAGFSNSEQAQIFGNNAASFYSL